MTERSKTKAPIKIKLDIDIDTNDRMRASFLDSSSKRIWLLPGRGLADLIPDGSEGPITLEVNDFFQRGTVYEVFGAILEDDGHTIAAHWQHTENGQQYTLPPLSAAEAAKVELLVGALPRRKDVAVPTPLAPKPRPDDDTFQRTAVDPPPNHRIAIDPPPNHRIAIDPPPKDPDKTRALQGEATRPRR